MPALDMEQLLAPVSAEAPCGADLEYDPDYLALTRAAQRVPEQVMGKHTVPAKVPDWADVQLRAERLTRRTKDIRVGVLLARALVNQHGLPGLRDGLKVLRSLLSAHWQGLYPGHEEGETTRLNALAELFDWDTLRADLLERTFFIARALGPVLIRDAAAVAGKYALRKDAQVRTADLLKQTFLQLPTEEQAQHRVTLRDSLHEYEALLAFVTEQVGSAVSVESKQLAELLYALNAAVASLASDDKALSTAPASPANAPAGNSGQVDRRDDVVRMLDQVCEYLERNEPSSPAPLLIRRAKQLVGKSFLEIIQDMAPGGEEQVRTITGVKATKQSSS